MLPICPSLCLLLCLSFVLSRLFSAIRWVKRTALRSTWSVQSFCTSQTITVHSTALICLSVSSELFSGSVFNCHPVHTFNGLLMQYWRHLSEPMVHFHILEFFETKWNRACSIPQPITDFVPNLAPYAVFHNT